MNTENQIEVENLLASIKDYLPRELVGIYYGSWFDDEGYSEPSAVIILDPRLYARGKNSPEWLEEAKQWRCYAGCWQHGIEVYGSTMVDAKHEVFKSLPLNCFILCDPTKHPSVIMVIESFGSQRLNA